MRGLREGETTILLPEAAPWAKIDIDLAAADRSILCAPGCLAVQIDPPRESHGEILIPDCVQGRLRADAGTVIATGDGVDVWPGQRVLLRPYHGLWMEPFASTEPAIVETDDGGLRAFGCNVLLRPDAPRNEAAAVAAPYECESQPRVVKAEILEPFMAIAECVGSPGVATGRVVSAGKSAWPVVGARVVYSRAHPRTGRQGLDRVEGFVVVEAGADHGRDARGTNQVYAMLGPSTFRGDMVRFYGAGTDWRKSILMVGDRLGWWPLRWWELIERRPLGGVEQLEVHAARKRFRARRLPRTGDCDRRRCAEVLVDPDPRESLELAWGPEFTAETAVLRSGVRQLVPRSAVWAVIE